MTSRRPLSIAVLISGGGTTLRNLIHKIAAGHLHAKIVLVIASSVKAKGVQFAQDAGIPYAIIESKSHPSPESLGDAVFARCRESHAELVVMAGFLKQVRIPDDFTNRVTNIHPGLIPAFCGKGYYGNHVHEAVLDYGAKVSGCTVHFADNQYDHGPVIAQKAVSVYDDDTPDALAARVFEAECEVYPEAIQAIAEGRVTIEGRKVRIARPS